MFRLGPILLLAFPAASIAALHDAGPIEVSDGDCQVTRILKDGRQVKSRSAEDPSSSTGAHASDGASAASASSRSGSGSSSASATSSSSSSGSGGSARAMSSHTDREGRTVTTTRDEKGCSIVIDERGT